MDDLQNIITSTMGRPQNQKPAQLYYDKDEASKYESNTRIRFIQTMMTERCIQLLNLPPPALILDIGCGSALSGEILTQNQYMWEGIDISRDMLELAASKQVEGGLMQIDMGEGFRFRAGTFDGAISVSALQWLCVPSKKSDNPFKRCCKFFQCLYECMVMGGRVVFQFYPEDKSQVQMLTTAAMKSGFSGGLVIDYPNSTKAKKYYLVLQAGGSGNLGIVQIKGKTEEMGMEQEEEQNEQQVVKHQKQKRKFERSKKIGKNKKTSFKSKDWIVKRKQRNLNKGKTARPTTKYTGRKRSKAKF